MKTCSKCGETKELTEFSKDEKYKDGHRSRCKMCIKEYNQEHYKKNKDNKIKKESEYREQNKEKIAERHRKYRERNREKVLEYQHEWREANPIKKRVSILKWRNPDLPEELLTAQAYTNAIKHELKKQKED